MLDHEPATDAIPVFVTEGRRRHHAVRVAAATLGLLIAGWIAALVAGLMGFGPLPTLSLPGDAGSHPAAIAATQPSSGHRTAGTGAATNPAPVRQSADDSRASADTRGAGGTGTTPSAAVGAGSGGSASAPASTGVEAGVGSDPAPAGGTGGTGGASQSNSGSEPAWTPPETGGKGATPPRGRSANAPGATVSATARGRATQPGG